MGKLEIRPPPHKNGQTDHHLRRDRLPILTLNTSNGVVPRMDVLPIYEVKSPKTAEKGV